MAEHAGRWINLVGIMVTERNELRVDRQTPCVGLWDISDSGMRVAPQVDFVGFFFFHPKKRISGEEGLGVLLFVCFMSRSEE